MSFPLVWTPVEAWNGWLTEPDAGVEWELCVCMMGEIEAK